MKNKFLSTTCNTVPYIKELRSLPLVKSVASAILMQQLDYWFEKYPDGFYKFMQPCPNHKAYREEDSWSEELAFSCDEFRTAFDAIGKRHTSKTAWREAADPFEGLYYCSYHDKKEGVTWYFRNHSLVDSALNTLHIADTKGDRPRTKPFLVDGRCQFTEMGNANLQRWATPIYRDGQCQSPLITEITPEITTETTTPLAPQQEREGVRESQEKLLTPKGNKAKIIASDSSTSTTIELERIKILQQLSVLLQDSSDNLQLNRNLISALDRYPDRIPDALAYLKQAIATWRTQPGIGAFIAALNKGHKPSATKPGVGWKEWADEAMRRKLFEYSHSWEGDILIHFKSGAQKLWSEVQSLSWEAIEAIRPTTHSVGEK